MTLQRLALALLMLLAACASANNTPAITHHAMRITLDPQRGFISVRDTISLPPQHAIAGAQFTLSSELAIISSDPPIKQLPAEAKEGQARYALQAPALDGRLTIHYQGVIDHGVDDEKAQYARGIRSSRGLLTPDGVYLHAGSAWHPSFPDTMLTFDLEASAPAGWHIISQGAGRSDDETTTDSRTARWQASSPMEQIYLVGGPLILKRETTADAQALIYLRQRDDALADTYLDATARYLRMYSDLIAPYPYAKFALVENFWETGYGMPSFTLLGSRVIRFPFILHSSYPHEILHNWWGNGVFVDPNTGNWCEGLTAYMADHLSYEQRAAGHAYRRDTLQKYRSYVGRGRDFPLSQFRSRHNASTEAVGYGKSLMFFHMLRRRVGDDDFRAALSHFYHNNAGKRAGFADILHSFAAVTGDDFSNDLSQWINRAGAPSLRLSDVQIADDDQDARTITGLIEQTQPGEPYILSVPLQVATRQGQQTHNIQISARSTPFRITVGAKPTALALDPQFDLFRLLDPREIPSAIGQLFGQPKVLAVLPANEPSEHYRSLMEGWKKHAHDIEIVHDNQLDALPADRCVWILGKTNRFAHHVLKAEPGAPIESLELANQRVSTDDATLVLTARNPANPAKTLGWICVDRDDAFPGLARKLPHYGKYSYLAFQGPEPTNFIKGQSDATDSPMIVELTPSGAGSITIEPRQPLAPRPVFASD